LVLELLLWLWLPCQSVTHEVKSIVCVKSFLSNTRTESPYVLAS